MCTTISQLIMYGVRPRSFFSSLKMGVDTFLYKKFGSRFLIDVVATVGVFASYGNIRRYEIATIERPERSISPSAFMQFIFDNADFNINILDGHNTFHAMGGIHYVTPSTAIDVQIQRKARMATNMVKLHQYHTLNVEKKNAGMKKLFVSDATTMHPIVTEFIPTVGDFVWTYGNRACVPKLSERKEYTKNILFLPLPFISTR